MLKTPLLILLITLAGALPQASYSATKTQFNSDNLKVRIVTRTPEQIAAFYEARGFLKPMVDKLKQYCFVGISIRNKSREIIWHNLQNWRFSAGDKDIARLDRAQLKRMWDSMNIPLAHQSTLRWTLLPEQLDFRPNEGEGGNVLIPWPESPVKISATFNTGQDKLGKVIRVEFEKVTCKK